MSWIHISKNKYVNTENGNAIIAANLCVDKDKGKEKIDCLEELVKWAKSEARYIDLTTDAEPLRTYLLLGNMVYGCALTADTAMARVLNDKILGKLEDN